jgi:repressor LexA
MTTTDDPVTITPRQREVLAFIARFYADHGYAVTNRQICRQFKFVSPNAAVTHLKPLRRHGLVTWQSGQARTIRPTQAGLLLLEGNSDG